MLCVHHHHSIITWVFISDYTPHHVFISEVPVRPQATPPQPEPGSCHWLWTCPSWAVGRHGPHLGIQHLCMKKNNMLVADILCCSYYLVHKSFGPPRSNEAGVGGDVPWGGDLLVQVPCRAWNSSGWSSFIKNSGQIKQPCIYSVYQCSSWCQGKSSNEY